MESEYNINMFLFYAVSFIYAVSYHFDNNTVYRFHDNWMVFFIECNVLCRIVIVKNMILN